MNKHDERDGSYTPVEAESLRDHVQDMIATFSLASEIGGVLAHRPPLRLDRIAELMDCDEDETRGMLGERLLRLADSAQSRSEIEELYLTAFRFLSDQCSKRIAALESLPPLAGTDEHEFKPEELN